MREVKQIQTYAEAKLRYEQIKPIRGKAGDVRPLGVRRNHQYRIAKRVSPLSGQVSYQCILHSTPVVVFKPDGDVEININGWATALTRLFIGRILHLHCYTKYQSTMLSLNHSSEVVLHNAKTTVIRRGEDFPFRWELVSSEPVYETQMNKKKANSVRAQYSEFEEYLKSTVKLREETRLEDYQGGKYVYKRITFRNDEFAEAGVFGESEVRSFPVELMTNDQPEENKHTNFYKAALELVMTIRGGARVRLFKGPEMHLESDSILPKFREIVYRHHSAEVFEKVLLPVGKAPSKKYDSWVK